VLLDAPIVMEGDGIEASWRPENSHGEFSGPMRLREALVKSRNLVSIRLLRELGTPYTIDYVTRFGFDKRTLPPEPDTGIGHGPVDAAGSCNRVRSVRKRRFPRDAVLRGPHRERRRPGCFAGQSSAWLAKNAKPVDSGTLVLTGNARKPAERGYACAWAWPPAPDQLAERVISSHRMHT